MTESNYVQATMISLTGMLEKSDNALFKDIAARSMNEAMPIIFSHYKIKPPSDIQLSLLVNILTILPAQKNGLVSLTDKGRKYFGIQKIREKTGHNIREEKRKGISKNAKRPRKTKDDL